MSISKLNNSLVASIAGFLQQPRILELVSKRFQTAMLRAFYPALSTRYSALPQLRSIVESCSDIVDLRSRVHAISSEVIWKTRGIYLGTALLQSMKLEYNSVLLPTQCVSLCDWMTEQNNRNLIHFFDRICDYVRGAQEFLSTLQGSEREKSAQIRVWLGKNQDKLLEVDVLDFALHGLTCLPNEIGYFTGVKQLHLNDNCLTTLPESLGALKKLELLSADNNYITHLPRALAELPCLQELSLNNNSMSCIPSIVYSLSNLKTLYWERNGLVELSSSIQQMSGLTRLNLGDNALERLPAEIGDLSNLSMLYLNNNRLTHLSGSLARLSNLSWINLNGNRLKTVSQALKDSANPALKENLYIKARKSKD